MARYVGHAAVDYTLRTLSKVHSSLPSPSNKAYTIAENDVVLLQSRRNPNADRIITSPLQAGGEIKLERDSIKVDNIIGRGLRETVETKRRRTGYRITRPTLAEYTDSSPRIVTPVRSFNLLFTSIC
jgi:tRNA (adenine57-N1/adenine58-N1)-methyltransferase catalytic subunit